MTRIVAACLVARAKVTESLRKQEEMNIHDEDDDENELAAWK